MPTNVRQNIANVQYYERWDKGWETSVGWSIWSVECSFQNVATEVETAKKATAAHYQTVIGHCKAVIGHLEKVSK